MKIIVLTSNAIRHKFVANTLAKHADKALAVCECCPNDAFNVLADQNNETSIIEHLSQRHQTEIDFFSGNDQFNFPSLPIIYGELHLEYIYRTLKQFKPDAIFVFGSSLVKEPILSLVPSGNFINMHLGLSPYYRGSGTNFWPFVNKELEYVGATILHIDAGVDTGDIIAHVRPKIEIGDDVHSVGCKVIKEGASCLVDLLGLLKSGKILNRVPQWEVYPDRYYKSSDFNKDILNKYKQNLENGLIDNYLSQPSRNIDLVKY
jgi:phosphoribosylglycinamide formyltransferase 1